MPTQGRAERTWPARTTTRKASSPQLRVFFFSRHARGDPHSKAAHSTRDVGSPPRRSRLSSGRRRGTSIRRSVRRCLPSMTQAQSHGCWGSAGRPGLGHAQRATAAVADAGVAADCGTSTQSSAMAVVRRSAAVAAHRAAAAAARKAAAPAVRDRDGFGLRVAAAMTTVAAVVEECVTARSRLRRSAAAAEAEVVERLGPQRL